MLGPMLSNHELPVPFSDFFWSMFLRDTSVLIAYEYTFFMSSMSCSVISLRPFRLNAEKLIDSPS